jgi:2-phosphosulfolactate phosphatase
MDLRIDFFREGARRAKGLCVIIDVFRACSVLCYVANKYPNQIILSSDINEIKCLKELYSDAVLIGKNHDQSQVVFNMKNSPSEILKTNIKNRTVVHYSEGGVSGLLECKNADEVITGSFVNANAVSKYIKEKSYDIVTLVCMGYLGTTHSEEDFLCANYIQSLVTDQNPSIGHITTSLLNIMGKYFCNKDSGIPKEDFYYCLDYNKFDFVLQLENNSKVRTLCKLNM